MKPTLLLTNNHLACLSIWISLMCFMKGVPWTQTQDYLLLILYTRTLWLVGAMELIKDLHLWSAFMRFRERFLYMNIEKKKRTFCQPFPSASVRNGVSDSTLLYAIRRRKRIGNTTQDAFDFAWNFRDFADRLSLTLDLEDMKPPGKKRGLLQFRCRCIRYPQQPSHLPRLRCCSMHFSTYPSDWTIRESVTDGVPTAVVSGWGR